jgi:uncharacterized protein (TIGR00303 family)
MVMIRVYTEIEQGQKWLDSYRGTRPIFAGILGFTDTGLIPGISAAGKTPHDRAFTCLADAEFLYNGPQVSPIYPLPPLIAGASPVLITRAVLEELNIPLYLFNAGLKIAPSVPSIDLGGIAAKCLTTGKALPLETVKHLWEEGLKWGKKLGEEAKDSYLILGECVVGGTTTALAVLIGLGYAAMDKVNSSHPQCNHDQKLAIVQEGLLQMQRDRELEKEGKFTLSLSPNSLISNPLELVAGVGDPMQIVVTAIAIGASDLCGVMLAGGTQMLAVYALMNAIAHYLDIAYDKTKIVVGTTRWVAEDPTGDTIGLAREIGTVPLIGTQLNFSESRYPQLQAYEKGFVKEGVGAGGCAIAASLMENWHQTQLLHAIEKLAQRLGENQGEKR